MEDNTRPPLTHNPTPGLYLLVIVEPVFLSNIIDTTSDQIYAFGKYPIECGIDNCLTHLICSEESLFAGKIQQCSNIGVRGVSGSAIEDFIRTIEFRITYSKKKKHFIRIDKVIYLPSVSKNLISASQWSVDRQDDDGVISKQQFSVFN